MQAREGRMMKRSKCCRQDGPAPCFNRFLFLATLLTCIFFYAEAGEHRYWVFFQDRGERKTIEQTRQYAHDLGISDRALWRRSRVLTANALLDEHDVPVSEKYLRRIKATGIHVKAVSRWFNAASVEGRTEQLALLHELPFVRRLQLVATFRKQKPALDPARGMLSLRKGEDKEGPEYGSSFTQLNNIGVVDLHKRGINGNGVIIGMIDDGFNEHRVHPALRNIKVLAEYDFVQRDNNTMRAPGEYPGQGNHGAGTLAVIGGYDQGKLIGAAYGASFLLAKTEVDSVEIRVEEDLYVEGLEWLERNGADIISSSLGYIDWYTYDDLNGKTAVTTRAASILARKGVLLVTAMGNEGTYRDPRARITGTLIAPADADSIVSVGATFSDGELASFSSTGPTSDGRIKPEVVAQGVSVFTMYGELGYGFSNGTSFATPLVAGVAALVLSVHPHLTPMEVRQRLLSTARPLEMTVPNNFIGWGMVDAVRAVGFVAPLPERFVLYDSYPNPFNGSTTISFGAPESKSVDLSIYDLLGRRVRILFNGEARVGENRFVWHDARDDRGGRVASGIYLVRLSVQGSVLTKKLVHIK
jgi:subtilisin family serine protease